LESALLSENICQGSFKINGRVLADDIGVGTQDYFMVVGALKERYFFNLQFFSPQVFNLTGDNEKTEGVQYAIKGPKVAYLSHGPLGHPGDGEYDQWAFSEITLTYRFYRGVLKVDVRGESELGLSGFCNVKQSLPPQVVQLTFSVLRPKLREFLRMTESGWSYFEKRLDAFPDETDA
jgi:hypothetical protein